MQINRIYEYLALCSTVPFGSCHFDVRTAGAGGCARIYARQITSLILYYIFGFSRCFAVDICYGKRNAFYVYFFSLPLLPPSPCSCLPRSFPAHSGAGSQSMAVHELICTPFSHPHFFPAKQTGCRLNFCIISGS